MGSVASADSQNIKMNCPDVTFELDPVVDFEPRPAANTENSEKQSDGVHIWDALAAISSTITDQVPAVYTPIWHLHFVVQESC